MHFAKRTTLTAMAGIVLGSSGLMASTTASAKEVTIWAWDPNFNIAIMQEAGKRYTAKHSTPPSRSWTWPRPIWSKSCRHHAISGVTKSLPDIVLVEDYNAPKYLRSFPARLNPCPARWTTRACQIQGRPG